MNLYFRVLFVWLASFFRPKINDILGQSTLNLHVLPNDLDTNLHMNNGRYATIMDLGRLDLTLRNGLLGTMLKRKCVPVLGAIQIRYRLSLMPFQAYRLETNVICWDEKWVYLKQEFIIKKGKKAGAVAAIGIVKGGFYDQNAKQTIPTRELLDILKMKSQSPVFPDYIIHWIQAEEKLRTVTKAL